jgi:hypothetical protein
MFGVHASEEFEGCIRSAHMSVASSSGAAISPSSAMDPVSPRNGSRNRWMRSWPLRLISWRSPPETLASNR